jgi:hypothetical protein
VAKARTLWPSGRSRALKRGRTRPPSMPEPDSKARVPLMAAQKLAHIHVKRAIDGSVKAGAPRAQKAKQSETRTR